MNHLFEPLTFPCGAVMKNRFKLAPMTNTQSHEDGTLSEEEFRWLTMRAQGGFAMTMTCASHVMANGKGFPGQLGIFSDKHIPGHSRLAEAIKSAGSLALVQLHHAGIRSPKNLVNNGPVAPSDHEKSGSRALTIVEVHDLRDSFIAAAVRAKKSGCDGVEVHGAHGYILAQFLSSKYNFRKDEYGGSLLNRARIIVEIIEGIRKACGPDFIIGLRLSPERFGMLLTEIKTLCLSLTKETSVDFLDISLWDCLKMPEEQDLQHCSLLEHFTKLDLGKVPLTVAGGIHSGAGAQHIIQAGVDFVCIGKAGILHHDFPLQIQRNQDFQSVALPVSIDYLMNEGLSDKFIEYMRRWPDFVQL
jgi:2,4-dienoyl-CoA reductase-like NADH-dependent reductase (Old Yellow Enzyme family)